MVSHDDGKHWKPLRLNMPTVAVHDLVVKDHDLVVGTMGRSIWILDNLTTIRQWKDDVRDKALHVFPTIPTFRWRYSSSVASYQMVGAGENPPVGVVVDYWLKSKPKKPMVVEIRNAKDELVRRIDTGKKPEKEENQSDEEEGGDEDSQPKTAIGHNRWIWDLRHEPAELIRGAQVDMGEPKNGPMVAPGQYKISLIVDGQTQSVSAEVIVDPRIKEPRTVVVLGIEGVEVLEVRPRETIPLPHEVKPKAGKKPDARDADGVDALDEFEDVKEVPAKRGTTAPPKMIYEDAKISIQKEALAQEALALRLRKDVTEVTEVVEGIRSIKKQIEANAKLIAKEPNVKPVLEGGKKLIEKLDALEEKLHNPKAKVSYDILAQKGGAKLYSQLVWLIEVSQDGDGPPTQGVLDLLPDLEKELAKYAAEYAGLRKNELAKLNEMATKAGLPTVWLPKAK